MSRTSTSIALLLLLSLVTCCRCQWMSPSQDWQVSLSPDSSRLSPALLSLRSSEEQAIKSPLAGRESFLMVSSLPEFEAQPITRSWDQHRLAKKQQQQQGSRKRSPVPSVDKWWHETMSTSNHNNNNNNRRRHGNYDNRRTFVPITPYEYPVRVPSTLGSLEGSEFLPYPLSFQHNKVIKKQVKKNKKPVPTYADNDSSVFAPSSSKAGDRVELERVSANPPEFLPPPTGSRSSLTLERAPLGTAAAAGPEVGRRRFQSLRLGYPVVRRREESNAESAPLIPDRMLGNDMMFKRNPLEADNARSGNDVDDDPNQDFELLQ